jgi:hypothetical protein
MTRLDVALVDHPVDGQQRRRLLGHQLEDQVELVAHVPAGA